MLCTFVEVCYNELSPNPDRLGLDFINTIDDKEKIKWQELFRQSVQVLLDHWVSSIYQDFGAR
jgi:hypothetical protein